MLDIYKAMHYNLSIERHEREVNKMDKNEMWDRLLEMGTSEETLQVVTCINGYSEETMLDILYAQYGYRNFDQLEDE